MEEKVKNKDYTICLYDRIEESIIQKCQIFDDDYKALETACLLSLSILNPKETLVTNTILPNGGKAFTFFSKSQRIAVMVLGASLNGVDTPKPIMNVLLPEMVVTGFNFEA